MSPNVFAVDGLLAEDVVLAEDVELAEDVVIVTNDQENGISRWGFGLPIADRSMEPGSDRDYRDRLNEELIYEFGNSHYDKL